MEWLRRGAKARTRKSKARIDDAGRLMRELSDIETRSMKGIAQIDFTATDLSEEVLSRARNVSACLTGR